MSDEDNHAADQEWLRKQRVESEHRAWALARARAIGGWILSAFTALWAGFDIITKFTDWLKK